MNCPNKSHPEYKALVEKYGEVGAMRAYVLNNEEIPSVELAEQLLYKESPNVNYQLKSVNILLSDKAKQIFDKGNKNSWSLDKILTELAIPKEQKALLLELGIKDREKLALELASKYRYAVEINTAKQYVSPSDKELIESKGYAKGNKINSSYYSGLTVPGGTNYTENEISTPLITPSIKGHAQFSTDKGIGWFRSDELAIGQIGLRDRYADLPMDIAVPGFKEGVGSKTRRILEIQSDLFQKGRTRSLLTVEKGIGKEISVNKFESDGIIYRRQDEKFFPDKWEYRSGNSWISSDIDSVITAYSKIDNSFKISSSDTQFLQLLNKDNNWVTFFIKSIIQDSAKKGYEKVLFPKGETAATIEGHQTIAEEINNINNLLDTYNSELKSAPDNAKWGLLGNIWRKETFNNKEEAEKWIEDNNLYDFSPEVLPNQKRPKNEVEKDIIRLQQRKQALKSQGIEKLKPIEAFYEIKVGNILEKQFGKDNVKTITDEYGNQWREIEIKSERDLKSIEFQRTNKDSFNSKKGKILKELMQKLYPGVNLEYTEEGIITPEGEEASGSYWAGNVLINSLLQSTDTLSHEYAHHYIKMFSNAPIVQQGIKLFGSEEKLVQAIGEGTVKALEWYNRFWNWIKGLFKVKQRTLNTLVESFISAKELGEKTAFNEEKSYQTKDDIYKEVKEKMDVSPEETLLVEKADVLQDIESALKDATKNLKFRSTKALKGSSSERRYISSLISKINDSYSSREKTSAEEAIIFAIADAKTSINAFYNQMQDAITNDKIDAKKLLLWKNLITGYFWLDKVKALVDNSQSELTKEFRAETVIKELDEIVKKRDFIINTFKTKGLPIVAMFLSNYSQIGAAKEKERVEKVYRNLDSDSKKAISFEEFWLKYSEEHESEFKDISYNTILKELEIASRDIDVLTRWFDTVLDSPDIVIGAASNAFSQMLTATNVQNLIVRDELLSAVKELEKKYGKHIVSDISEMYDFMLEKDSKGNRTGHRVDRYRSSLKTDIDKKRSELDNNKDLSESDKIRKYWEFFNKVAPRRDNDYYRDRIDFIKDLYESEDVTAEEYKALLYNDSLDYRGDPIWKLRKDGRISSIAADKISAWEQQNDMLYRDPIEEYRNPQFDELKKIAGSKSDDIEDWSDSDPRIKFYKLIVKLGQEADLKVKGSGRQLGTRLPGIMATSLERIKGGQSAVELFKNNLKQSLWELNPEESDVVKNRTLTDAQGVEHRFVPVRFTTKLDTKDMSFDIASLYMAYTSSANKYANTMQILPELEMIKEFTKDRQSAVTKKGKPVLDEPAGGIFSKIKDWRVLKPKNKSNLADQYEDWLNLVVYEEGMDKTRIDKIIQTLSKYTAFRVLSLNLMNGITNVLTGETLQKVEAISKQHTSFASLAKASLIYDKNIGSLMKDIGSRAPSSLVNLLTEQFRILDDEAFVEFRKGTKVQQLFNTSKLFFLMHAGEHWMQSRFFMAMLNDKKAYDKDGKELGSMLDMYKSVPIKDEKGEVTRYKLELDSRVDEKKSKWTESDRTAFSTKVKGLLRGMHGAYAEEERRAIDKFAVGRALVQFRKFVAPGVGRRWSRKYYNTSMQEYSEGYYRTWGKWMKELGIEIFGLTIGLKNEEGIRKRKNANKLKKLAWQGTFGNDSWEDIGLTHYDIANIKKMNAEIVALMATIALVSAIIPMLEGDDDEKERRKQEQFAYYYLLQASKFILLRFGSEQMFFWNPAEFVKLMNSPMASYATINDSVDFLFQLGSPTEVYERGSFRGENKLWHKFLDLFPIIRQMYKLKDITGQTSWLKQRNIINWVDSSDEEKKEERQERISNEYELENNK